MIISVFRSMVFPLTQPSANLLTTSMVKVLDFYNGLMDIVVHIDTTALELTGTDTEAVLEGETFDGVKIRGINTVRIVKE